MRAKKILFEEEEFKPRWIKNSKSKEDLLNLLKDKSPHEKFKIGVIHNIPWLVEEILIDGENKGINLQGPYDIRWAMHYSVLYDHIEMVKLLLEYPTHGIGFETAIMDAVETQNVEIFKLLYDDERSFTDLTGDELYQVNDFKKWIFDDLDENLNEEEDFKFIKSSDNKKEKYKLNNEFIDAIDNLDFNKVKSMLIDNKFNSSAIDKLSLMQVIGCVINTKQNADMIILLFNSEKVYDKFTADDLVQYRQWIWDCIYNDSETLYHDDNTRITFEDFKKIKAFNFNLEEGFSGAGYAQSAGSGNVSGGTNSMYTYNILPLNHSLEPKPNDVGEEEIHIGLNVKGKKFNDKKTIYKGKLTKVNKSPDGVIESYVIMCNSKFIKLDPTTVEIDHDAENRMGYEDVYDFEDGESEMKNTGVNKFSNQNRPTRGTL